MFALAPRFDDEDLLATPELGRVRGHMTRVALAAGTRLHHAHEPVQHGYILIDGLVSLQCTDAEGSGIEAAIIGPGGMVGAEALLNGEAPSFSACVPVDAQAWRIELSVFAEFVARCPALANRVRRCAADTLRQAFHYAACNARHRLEARLARTILTADVLLGGRAIALTHGTLSDMLGVRRAGVTVALHILEGERAIYSKRGVIAVRDRAQLEARACACHRTILAGYAAPPLRPAAPAQVQPLSLVGAAPLPS